MALANRLALYKSLERKRKRPLLVYVTSPRANAQGSIGGDVVGEFLAQLEALPRSAKSVDLLIVSHGGDPTVAWRIVSLIRERVDQLAVLVPQAAFSAATLIALGADEIVMHPNGNLGPVDPQIHVQRPGVPGGPPQQMNFGSEDLLSFLDFAKERAGLSDQAPLLAAFQLISKEVGAVPIGVAARSAQLSLALGERLLSMHAKDEAERQRARTIAEALNKKFFHHGYPVSRKEAREIGLKVAAPDRVVEGLIWRIWVDMATEIQARTPFEPLAVLSADPGTAGLFGPVPQISLPANLPPQVAMQLVQQMLAAAPPLPPAPFRLTFALVESCRMATRFEIAGRIYGVRLPDLQVQISVINDRTGWVDVPMPPR